MYRCLPNLETREIEVNLVVDCGPLAQRCARARHGKRCHVSVAGVLLSRMTATPCGLPRSHPEAQRSDAGWQSAYRTSTCAAQRKRRHSNILAAQRTGEADGGAGSCCTCAHVPTQRRNNHTPASHEEGCGDCRVEMPSRDPRGRIDQHSQAKTVANGGGRQPGAHRVGVTPSPKEGEEEHADEFGEHAA